MKNGRKKSILSLLVAGLLALTAFGGLGNVKQASADTAKPIDVYLIGGQSNAVGYSPILSNPTETFENVWYAGESERYLLREGGYSGAESNITFNTIKKSVRAGYGLSSDRIGPEYGMAKVLSSYATEQRPSLIFKTAAGGTTLQDANHELSAQFGNWYPRSLWDEGYTPNITQGSATNDPTGVLYHLFVKNFEKTYDELVANGYQPVVRGMAWMQGETDLNRADGIYDDLLETFITDLRYDLAQITGDQKVLGMPFVIGEIATSFVSYGNPAVPPLIAMQRQAADRMGNSVATVATDDLIIVRQDGGSNGPDPYHFAFTEAKTLGERFANKLLEIGDTTRVSCSCTNGDATWSLSENQVTLTLLPDEHYKLSKLTLNGTDVTAQVKDLQYSATLTEKENIFVAEFVKKTAYAVEYEASEFAGYAHKYTTAYEGETLALKIYPAKNYEVVKVFYNDEEMTYNAATGKYEIIPTENGRVKIQTTGDVVATDSSSSSSSSTEEKKGSGCGGAVGLVGIPAMLAVFGVAVLKKRSK